MVNEKRLIDANALIEKLSRMIDYCKEDSKVNGLTALFQIGDAIMDCPTVDAVELARDRLFNLQNVSGRDYQDFVDGLHDYFVEAAFEDRSVGIFGMSEGETLLANALMDFLNGVAKMDG